ncbi:protein SET-like [Hypanus sabinus]|uniref:protein SET-like n=1 Tax=Hypanus sabinus TaxID=79690 RepID=UPI0028C4D7D4|nr:protein SET-like [Hypanus sabinus]
MSSGAPEAKQRRLDAGEKAEAGGARAPEAAAAGLEAAVAGQRGGAETGAGACAAAAAAAAAAAVAGQPVSGATQRALEAVDACQRELEALSERAGEEILRVERKYGELRRPHFERRNRLIEDIPGFWVTAVSFPRICLTLLTGKPVSQSTPIKWKKGMDLISLNRGLGEKGRKRGHRSFFSWFTEHRNPTTDEIAEVLKDDMWPNPLQYFLIAESESGENGLDDSDEENGEGSVVIVDEDDDEDDVQEIVDNEDEEDDVEGSEDDEDVEEINEGEEEGVEVEGKEDAVKEGGDG